MPVYEMAGNWVRLALCGMVGQVVYKGLHLLLGMNLMGMVDNHTLLFIGKRTEALHGFGTLCQGQDVYKRQVYNSVKDTNERIGRILQMHANHRQDIDIVYAGDIAAAIGVKNTTTGDTLCDEKHPVILESMEFPEPVIRVAIEPKTKAGQEKMGIALAKLAEEDPTFKAYTDEETGGC